MRFSTILSGIVGMSAALASNNFSNFSPLISVGIGLGSAIIVKLSASALKHITASKIEQQASKAVAEFFESNHWMINGLKCALTEQQIVEFKEELRKVLVETLDKIDSSESIPVSSNPYVKQLSSLLVPYIDLDISESTKVAIANHALDRAIAPFIQTLYQKFPAGKFVESAVYNLCSEVVKNQTSNLMGWILGTSNQPDSSQSRSVNQEATVGKKFTLT